MFFCHGALLACFVPGEAGGTLSAVVSLERLWGRVLLLGVPVDAVTMVEAVAAVRRYLDSQRQHHVATPNNEMLVASSQSRTFLVVLQSTSLNVPDSTGLLLAARLTGQHLPERVTGTDVLQRLCCELSAEYPVFFLGAGEGVAERAAAALKARNPRLKVAGTYAGSPRDEDAADIVSRINASGAVLLFVAYGAPAQELWIAKHLSSLTGVRVAMGVGGAFDFVACVRKRAPALLRRVGLEWLWRLFLQPQRLGRIARALVVFPLLILRYGKLAPPLRA